MKDESVCKILQIDEEEKKRKKGETHLPRFVRERRYPDLF